VTIKLKSTLTDKKGSHHQQFASHFSTDILLLTLDRFHLEHGKQRPNLHAIAVKVKCVSLPAKSYASPIRPIVSLVVGSPLPVSLLPCYTTCLRLICHISPAEPPPPSSLHPLPRTIRVLSLDSSCAFRRFGSMRSTLLLLLLDLINAHCNSPAASTRPPHSATVTHTHFRPLLPTFTSRWTLSLSLSLV
jgi:hypothetical protein